METYHHKPVPLRRIGPDMDANSTCVIHRLIKTNTSVSDVIAQICIAMTILSTAAFPRLV